MTNQSDIKKLAEQMAGSMNSFDDIKDFIIYYSPNGNLLMVFGGD